MIIFVLQVVMQVQVDKLTAITLEIVTDRLTAGVLCKVSVADIDTDAQVCSCRVVPNLVEYSIQGPQAVHPIFKSKLHSRFLRCL